MNQTKKGTILTLVAGFSWGISGISGQYLMANGVHVNLLTSLRLLIAGLFLTVLAYFQDKKTLKILLTSKKNLLGIGFFALFGLVLNQYAYLSAIHHTNAGTATGLALYLFAGADLAQPVRGGGHCPGHRWGLCHGHPWQSK